MRDISINDRDLLINKLGNIINSEYQFTTLFIWQHCYHFQIEEYKNGILVFGCQNNGNPQCYYPLGMSDDNLELLEYAKELFRLKGTKFNFRPLNEEMKNHLIGYLGKNIVVGSKDSYSDYIYNFNEIRSYYGPKYKRKRKELHQFLSKYKYNYMYETITEKNISECLSRLKEIVMMDKNYDKNEILAYTKLFLNFKKLHVRGGFIRINGNIQAVSVGEPIGDMILMHVRRANKQFVGIYPTMLYLILNNEFDDHDYKIVNTQDDMGKENIRIAKMSYKPLNVMKKYYIEEI